MANYYTLLTPAGLAKVANAQLTQDKVVITQVAVGDANGVGYLPSGAETALKREVWRGGVASIEIDALNPNWIVVEAIVPATVGGFTMREVALYDAAGDMIAIGNYPDTYKPVAADGSTMDLALRTIIEVNSAESVTLKIDPNVIVASRAYVDAKVAGAIGGIGTTLTALDERVTTHLAEDNEQAHGITNIAGLSVALESKADLSSTTWEKIAEIVLTESIKQVDFSEIPSDFKYLRIIYDAKSGNDSFDNLTMRFNNDSTNNYRYQVSSASGTTTDFRGVNTVQHFLIGVKTLPQSNRPFSFGTVDISCLDPSKEKRILAFNFGDDGSATSNLGISTYGGQWLNTTEAINKISFIAPASTISVGSSFCLWGCR